MRTFRSVMSAVGAAAAVAACGTAHRAASVSGPRVFAAECSGCHTISGHPNVRHQGGDLLDLPASRTQLLQFAREMPVPHPLSHDELEAVVSYVHGLEVRARRGG